MPETKSKILVVEDDEDEAKLVKIILSQEGYEVNWAPNGKVAIEMVDSFDPDLIILDVMMPELDGFAACRRLKDSEKKNIPVILLTAKGRDIDKRLGYEVGATDYIIKPFSPNKLIDRIHELLSCTK